jgi:hypothetical protein
LPYQEEVTKTVKTFLATWKPAGGVIRGVLVREEHGGRAYFGTDPAASVQAILEAAAGRTAIAEAFKEGKEGEGAGQQPLRSGRAQEGAFPGWLWGYTVVARWAWEKPLGDLGDRSDSPWDDAERRPSPAHRRRALPRELLAGESWRRWGDQPCPPEIREIVGARLATAA